MPKRPRHGPAARIHCLLQRGLTADYSVYPVQVIVVELVGYIVKAPLSHGHNGRPYPRLVDFVVAKKGASHARADIC